MNRRVAIVLVCTFLALVAATVWVPTYETDGVNDFWVLDPSLNPISARFARIEYRWMWDRVEPYVFDAGYHEIYWPLLLAQQALILLGGGVLTLVVRRERRKRAAV